MVKPYQSIVCEVCIQDAKNPHCSAYVHDCLAYMCMTDLCCVVQENLPIVHILCNPGLRQRHWEQMNEITGFSITPDSGTSLRKMLKYNLEPHFEDFEGTCCMHVCKHAHNMPMCDSPPAISGAASKEYSLEKAMQRMEDEWDPIIFNTTQYRDTGNYKMYDPLLDLTSILPQAKST